jgi:hypothetical protein
MPTTEIALKYQMRMLWIVIAIHCASCTYIRPVPRSMVVGRYDLDCRNTGFMRGTEELELKEDGTFIQTYSPSGAEPVQSHTGRWELHGREKWIGFSSLASWEGHDLLGFPVKNPPSSYRLPVGIYGNAVHVVLNADLDITFKKAIK